MKNTAPQFKSIHTAEVITLTAETITTLLYFIISII